MKLVYKLESKRSWVLGRRHLHGAAQTPPGGQALRARWVQAMHSAWSTTRCEAARAHPCLLLGGLFIRLHHLHLPPHQTGTYKAGCAGSGQATSQPSG